MSTTTKVQIDTKTFIRFWLVIIGFVAAGYLIYKASFGLSIIFAALFFALAISPLVKTFANLLPSKNRNFGIALSYILVVGFIIAFLSVVVPTVINESIKFFSNLPSIFNSATDGLGFFDKIGRTLGIENLQGEIFRIVQNFSRGITDDFGNILTTSISSIGSFFAVVILSLVLAFFMLTEGPSIVNQFWNSMSKTKSTKRAQHVVSRLADTVSKYVSGAVTVGLINACATAVAVFIICLCFQISPGFAFPFGLITGVFSLIPMFGSFIGGAIVSLLLGFNALWAGIAFLIYTIVYLQIESNVISPKVQGKGMKLPALVVLSAVTIGVYTFGLAGAIISIPIAGCIKILIEEFGADWMDDGKINASNFKEEKHETKTEIKKPAKKEERLIAKD